MNAPPDCLAGAALRPARRSHLLLESGPQKDRRRAENCIGKPTCTFLPDHFVEGRTTPVPGEGTGVLVPADRVRLLVEVLSSAR